MPNISLNGEWVVQQWWDNHFPQLPYWQLNNNEMKMAELKYRKKVLKEVRYMLQKDVKNGEIVSDVKILEIKESETIFSYQISFGG
jgi:hypothetical protein